MAELLRTPLYDRHLALGAQLVEFGGWEMPLAYPTGIVAEHLATRRGAGLFDVSHMGRFAIAGAEAVPFLQHVLTNNVLSPEFLQSQYTILPTETGGAVDDAYLYRFLEDEYLLVVNASNRTADWEHLLRHRAHFGDVTLSDRSEAIAMLALQGPESREILTRVIDTGSLPEPLRNELSVVRIGGAPVRVSRTGYTGEPLCFELFTHAEGGPALWDRLLEQGATPVGLGARDTLRLEAALPLYGHELGADPEGHEIPVFSQPMAKNAVSFSPLKGNYIGRAALLRQHAAFERITYRDTSLRADLPRLVQPVALLGPGVARAGDPVFRGDRPVGHVTSGTRVPYWEFDGEGLDAVQTDRHSLRSICLAYLDCDLVEDDRVSVEVRGRRVDAVVVEVHLRSEAPPFARPILCAHETPDEPLPDGDAPRLA
ncbi:MAG TPA: hypothetical protein VK997_01090, partial [Deferrisomatales bacterium]|nr:hypothetical protein [Deferrisomatales bacterium]